MLVFTIFQWARTLYNEDASEDMLTKLFKQLLKKNTPYSHEVDNIQVKLTYPASRALGVVAIAKPLIQDLGCVLFINKTDSPFITSDNPVVLYNQFLEKRNEFTYYTGLAAKGLQIFLPISPKYYLLFFDQDAYSFSEGRNRVLELKKKIDVDALNQLQCVNSYYNLYFNEGISEDTIRVIFNKIKKYRRETKNIVETQPEKFFNGECRSIISASREDVKINLELSFISIIESAFISKIGNKALIVRNEWLYKAVQCFSEQVRKEKYTAKEFDKFLKEHYSRAK